MVGISTNWEMGAPDRLNDLWVGILLDKANYMKGDFKTGHRYPEREG